MISRAKELITNGNVAYKALEKDPDAGDDNLREMMRGSLNVWGAGSGVGRPTLSHQQQQQCQLLLVHSVLYYVPDTVLTQYMY